MWLVSLFLVAMVTSGWTQQGVPPGQGFAPGLSNNFPLFSNFDFNRPIFKREPSYFILASRFVKPGQIYRVFVNLLDSDQPVTVRASISSDGIEIAHGQAYMIQNIPDTLLLKIPNNIVKSDYYLRVEGNVNGVGGGTAFINSTKLTFDPRANTIFIQTDKPVYKQEETLRFRAIPLTPQLKPFEGTIDIYMMDPDGFIMRRWLTRQTNLGAVSLNYTFGDQPKFGTWVIKVKAMGQEESKSFEVEEYFQPRFEVNISMPAFFMDKEFAVTGVITANYTNGLPVFGNCTIQLIIRPRGAKQAGKDGSYPTIERFRKWFDGVTDFMFTINELRSMVPNLAGSEVEVQAFVGDPYLNIIQMGYAQALIYNSSLRLQFLGSSPQVFKPDMPFKSYVAASYQDGSMLINGIQRVVEIKMMYQTVQGAMKRIRLYQDFIPSSGIIEVFLNSTPKDAQYLMFEVTHNSLQYGPISAQMVALRYVSIKSRFLHISTSTRNARVGEYIIFHARSSFYIDGFYYLVLSKGTILHGGFEKMTSLIKTFAVTLTSQMAPSAHIVIYHIHKDGQVTTDSLTFPVNGISRNVFNVTLNRKKDLVGKTVEVVVRGDPGAYVGLSGIDATLFAMQAGNELSHASVLDKMNSVEDYSNGTLSYSWMSQEGNPDKAIHNPVNSFGVDANRTFEYLGLVVFTDANITRLADFCNPYQGFGTCMDGACYRIEKRCDRTRDCKDGSDESNCPSDDPINMNTFRMFRMNRLLRTYENVWLWKDINIGPEGHFIFTAEVPERPAQYVISAFSMSISKGFGLLAHAQRLASSRPFYITVEMADHVSLGEQIGIRVGIFNNLPFEIEVELILASSEDYKFVHVEPLGVVTSYNPRTSFGEHQHLVWIEAGKTTTIYVPIVPVKLGEIDVTISAKTQIGSDSITRQVIVGSDGVEQLIHTSLLLDLSNRAYVIRYLDVNTTQDNWLPLQIDRLFVIGSPKVTISVVGDVVGPSFPVMPMESFYMLQKPYGCGEQNMFNFAANIYTLRYLRMTNQLTDDISKTAFEYLNIGYQRQLNYQNRDGSFGAYPKRGYFMQFYGKFKYRQSQFSSGSVYQQYPNGTVISGSPRSFGPGIRDGSFNYNYKPFIHNDPRAYQRQMSYQNADRSFGIYPDGETQSVWLTAFVARVLRVARYSEWEPFLYIDPRVISKAMEWLISKQTPDGCFMETIDTPYDRKMRFDSLRKDNTWARLQNISLTAHVLITLAEVNDLSGPIASEVSGAKRKAVTCLERQISKLVDPYEIAITTYALTLVNSGEKEVGYGLLEKSKHDKDGLIHWGREAVPPSEFILQSNQPHLKYRLPTKYDASNVESTSYALLVYSLRDSFIVGNIVNWLHTQRGYDGGFASTQDTIVALQALSEYSIRYRFRYITDMEVTIAPSSVPGFEYTFHIGPDNLSKLQPYVIPNPWGHIHVVARGAGIAILQLTVEFNVDNHRYLINPPIRAFDLRAEAIYSGRNRSTIALRTCASWNLISESPESGMAVIEVDVPSGYVIQDYELDEYMHTEKPRFLKLGEVFERKVVWYFDKLDSKGSCVQFSAERWYPVANLTRFITVKVYDFYAPERFNTTYYEAFTLYTLDICQVCGSYQCPYCPIFNTATISKPCWINTIINIAFILICHFLSCQQWTS